MHRQHTPKTIQASPWNHAETEVALAIARHFAARGSRVLGLAQADKEDFQHDILLVMLLRARQYNAARSAWPTFSALLARHAMADRVRSSRLGHHPIMVMLDPEAHAERVSATAPFPCDEFDELILRLDVLSVAAMLPARLHETLRLLICHDNVGAAWRSSSRSCASFHRDIADLRTWLHTAGLLSGHAPRRIRNRINAPEVGS